MVEKKYGEKIENLREVPITAPIVIYGKPGLTCAQLYNAIYERIYNGNSHPEQEDTLPVDIISPIIDLLTALLYDRWARLADVDIEDTLMERMDRIYRECNILDGNMFDHPEPKYDYNAFDNIFDDTSLASEWMGEAISKAISDSTRHNSGFGKEDPIIYMAGELGDGSRPCFKNSGWDIMRNHVAYQLAGLLNCMFESGVRIYIVSREDLRKQITDDYVSYAGTSVEELSEFCSNTDNDITQFRADFSDGELIDSRIEYVDLSKTIGVLSCIYDEPYEQYDHVLLLELLGQIPDEYDYVLMVSASKGEHVEKAIKKLTDSTGIKFLCKFGDDDELPYPTVSQNLFKYVERQYTPNEWIYNGIWNDKTMNLMYENAVTTHVSSMAEEIIEFCDALSTPYDLKFESQDPLNEIPEYRRALDMTKHATGGFIDVPAEHYHPEMMGSRGLRIVNNAYNARFGTEERREYPEDIKFGGNVSKLIAVNNLYVSNGIFKDVFSTRGLGKSVELTDDTLIGFADKVYARAKELDLDVYMRAMADGISAADVMA